MKLKLKLPFRNDITLELEDSFKLSDSRKELKIWKYFDKSLTHWEKSKKKKR